MNAPSSFRETSLKTSTWLPVFPGFYETGLTPSDNEFDQEIENLLEGDAACRRIGFNDLHALLHQHINFRLERLDTAQNIVEIVSSLLKESGAPIETIHFERLSSPRFYNFETDAIHCKVLWKEGHKSWFRRYLTDNLPAFRKYLMDRYTHRSGFVPFHSNDPWAWTYQLDGACVVSEAHYWGALLQFVYENEYDPSETLEVLRAKLQDEYWSNGHGNLSDFIDYDGLNRQIAEYDLNVIAQ